MSGAVEVAGWYDLLARYEAAQADAERYCAESYEPFARAQRVLFPEWPKPNSPDMVRMREWNKASGFEAIADRYEEMVDTYANMADKLIRRAAPDAKAALWKFDYLYCGDDEGTSWDPDYIKQANADIRRFLENA